MMKNFNYRMCVFLDCMNWESVTNSINALRYFRLIKHLRMDRCVISHAHLKNSMNIYTVDVWKNESLSEKKWLAYAAKWGTESSMFPLTNQLIFLLRAHWEKIIVAFEIRLSNHSFNHLIERKLASAEMIISEGLSIFYCYNWFLKSEMTTSKIGLEHLKHFSNMGKKIFNCIWIIIYSLDFRWE